MTDIVKTLSDGGISDRQEHAPIVAKCTLLREVVDSLEEGKLTDGAFFLTISQILKGRQCVDDELEITNDTVREYLGLW